MFTGGVEVGEEDGEEESGDGEETIFEAIADPGEVIGAEFGFDGEFGDHGEGHFDEDHAGVEADAQPEGVGAEGGRAAEPTEGKEGGEAREEGEWVGELVEGVGDEIETGEPADGCWGVGFVWFEEVDDGEEGAGGEEGGEWGKGASEEAEDGPAKEGFFEESDDQGGEGDDGDFCPRDGGSDLEEAEGEVGGGEEGDGEGGDGEAGEEVVAPAGIGGDADFWGGGDVEGADGGPEEEEGAEEGGAVEVFLEGESGEAGEDAVSGEGVSGEVEWGGEEGAAEDDGGEVEENFSEIFQAMGILRERGKILQLKLGGEEGDGRRKMPEGNCRGAVPRAY